VGIGSHQFYNTPTTLFYNGSLLVTQHKIVHEFKNPKCAEKGCMRLLLDISGDITST
jgi:hypothetical protein